MHVQSGVSTLVASDTATVTGGVGVVCAGGVGAGVVATFTVGAGAGVVANFTVGAGAGVVAFTTGASAVVGVVVVAPIGTVTAGMAKPANDVLDNTNVGVVADA